MIKEKIYFIENSINFNANSINENKIRGTEKTLINISNHLQKKNYDIFVFNNCSNLSVINGVHWENINNFTKYSNPDYLVAWSDANLLNFFKCNNKYLWSHSIQPLEKFIRKKQLLAFYKNKPIVITESKYHFNKRSFFTSLYGKKIIYLAPDSEFTNTNINLKVYPNPNAIFTTRPDRNINFLISAWFDIFKENNKSKLFINPPYSLSKKEIKNNINLRILGDKFSLIKDLLNSRLMLVPGHKGEVFCLAAAEAQEMCIPIVTMGYGCLEERVQHLKTGFIAKNKKEFTEYASIVLNDDSVFQKFRNNLLEIRGSKNWSLVADSFVSMLKN